MGYIEQEQVTDTVRVSDGPGSIWVKIPCAFHPSVHPLCLPPIYPSILSPIRLIQSSIYSPIYPFISPFTHVCNNQFIEQLFIDT